MLTPVVALLLGIVVVCLIAAVCIVVGGTLEAKRGSERDSCPRCRAWHWSYLGSIYRHCGQCGFVQYRKVLEWSNSQPVRMWVCIACDERRCNCMRRETQ